MAEKKQYKLDLGTVLLALDRKDFGFYNRLGEEEKKGYVPVNLMRYMSSLKEHKLAGYAVLLANDLVNIGLWELYKHPELQHLLLCLTGLGSKQFRPWLSSKKTKRSGKIANFLYEHHPDANDDEIDIILSNFDLDSWKDYVKSSGINDAEVKEMIAEWKKVTK